MLSLTTVASAPITARANCRPGDCTPSPARAYYYGYRRYYRPGYYYAPAWQQSYFGPRWGGYGGW
jgi:hypothetical protein